jgi:hypothetical protein
MYSNGTGSNGVIKESGTFGCPMTGEKAMWMRSELKIASSNKVTYTTYSKDPQAKNLKGWRSSIAGSSS